MQPSHGITAPKHAPQKGVSVNVSSKGKVQQPLRTSLRLEVKQAQLAALAPEQVKQAKIAAA